MNLPTIDDDPMHAPPWKVDAPPFGLGVWSVLTDRGGDLSEEYDLFENPPEWVVRLIAVAPELFAICEMTLKLDARSDSITGEIIRRIMAVQKEISK